MGVPHAENGLIEEEDQCRQYERVSGFEPLGQVRIGEEHPPAEEKDREDLHRAADECQRGAPGGLWGGHSDRPQEDACEHQAEQRQAEPQGERGRTPEAGKGVACKPHDEESDPAEDLRVSVGVDVIQRDPGEIASRPDLPEDPRAPGCAGGEDRDDSGDQKGAEEIGFQGIVGKGK
ncbi:MAG: hypothetical protein PHF14_01575 [Verrucomicrobiota bacterium]|nr:hypothetical protein [Verrucomicrobiota bacterium]